MDTSNPHQLTQQTTAETTVELWTERAEKEVQHLHERSKRSGRNYVRSRPIRAAAREVRHLHQLERAGESEWTPWIAIAGLILFLGTIGLLMFGIVEAASHLLASASPEGKDIWP